MLLCIARTERTQFQHDIHHDDVCAVYNTLVFSQITKPRNIFDCPGSGRFKVQSPVPAKFSVPVVV